MKHKLFFRMSVLSLLGLGIIFSLTVTDIFSFNSNKDLLEISVILREDDNFIGTSMQQGMQKAAIDLGVELRMLTPTNRNNCEEQETFFNYEIELGAEAIIIDPINSEKITTLLGGISPTIPVVSMGSKLDDKNVKASVGLDINATSELLCEYVKKDVEKDKDIIILNTSSDNDYFNSQIELTNKNLKFAGYNVEVFDVTSDLLASFIVKVDEYDVGAFLGFEVDAIERIIELFEKIDCDAKIYGIGSNSKIISLLEEELISAIIAQNDYAAGYLAVDNAVRAIQQNKIENQYVPFALVEPDTIYTKENEKLLFPMT